MTVLAPHRRHALYLFFVLHRVSGLLLALFLPVHFWVLAQALTNPQRLDGFLRWTDAPLVKAAETLLVVLLAAHMLGGLRLLALELLPWRDAQKTRAAIAAALALLVGLLFLLNASWA
jgi:fumarate reductase subunit D